MLAPFQEKFKSQILIVLRLHKNEALSVLNNKAKNHLKLFAGEETKNLLRFSQEYGKPFRILHSWVQFGEPSVICKRFQVEPSTFPKKLWRNFCFESVTFCRTINLSFLNNILMFFQVGFQNFSVIDRKSKPSTLLLTN